MAKATGDYKLILVVRNDLKMGKGKIAAQVRGLSQIRGINFGPKSGSDWPQNGTNSGLFQIRFQNIFKMF